jgi:hypothetical protein
MKLQLHGQQLRLRLAEAEFAQLLQGDTVTASTQLPGGGWRLDASATDESAVQLDGGDRLRLRLPLALLRDYQQRLPCRDGVVVDLTLADDATLQISVEVDVRDSVRVRGVRRKA